jgi:hypothetical protein
MLDSRTMSEMLDDLKTTEEKYSFLLKKGFSLSQIQAILEKGASPDRRKTSRSETFAYHEKPVAQSTVTQTPEQIASSLLPAKEKQITPYTAQPTTKSPIKLNSNPSSTQFATIVGVFGSILLGVGLITLVSANWQGLSNEIKVLLLLGIMVFLQVLGFAIRMGKGMIHFGNAIMISGLFAFGANIFLISQIYNLSVDWADGFLYWFIGSSFVALLLNSRMIHTFCLGLLAIIGLGSGVTTASFQYRPYNTIAQYSSLALIAVACFVATMLVLQAKKHSNPSSTIL